MFRVIIHIVGVQNSPWLDFETEALADTYIAEMTASQHWGKNAYEVQIGLNDDVTPYASTRIESKYIVHTEGQPDSEVVAAGLPPQGTLSEDILYEHKFGTIAAEVTFEKQDVTAEYNQKILDQYMLDQVALADASVATALQGYDRTTIIADNLAQLLIYLNVKGTQTVEEIAAAKTAVLSGLDVYNQMKAIQATMYTNIAAKKAELGL